MEQVKSDCVTKEIENTSFDCGIDSINEYVKNSYLPFLLQEAYTYELTSRGVVLGYYQIMFKEIKLLSLSEDFSEYESDIANDKTTAVHIRFIAVAKEWQRRKIGTAIMHTIIKKIETLSFSWPIRVITLDAVVYLVEWYRKLGFHEMKENPHEQDGVTVAMYYNCMHNQKKLKEYESEML